MLWIIGGITTVVVVGYLAYRKISFNRWNKSSDEI